MNTGNYLVPQVGREIAPVPGYYPGWEEEEVGGASLDITELRAMLFRQRYWIAASLALCFLLGIAATLTMPRIYRAAGSVQIEPTRSILAKDQQGVEPEVTAQNMQQYLQAQVDVLKSRSVAERVANQLGLYASGPYLKAMGIPASSRALQREGVVESLRKNLNVDFPMGSQVAQISFDSPDPALSAQIVNAYAESLILGNMERKFDSSSYARQFLEKEIQAAKGRLESSQHGAVAYARSAGLVDTGGGTQSVGPSGGSVQTAAPTSLSASSLIQMNNDLSSARTARIQAEQRWRTAAATPVMSLPEVIENSTIQGLQGERSRLSAALSKMRQTYGEGYPEIGRTRSELAAIDSEIQSVAGRIRSSIKERADVAARQEGSIAGRISGLRAQTLQEQDRRVQWDILNREAATNQQLYDGLLQRYREVSTAAAATNNNISILDKAVPPRMPFKPRPLVNMALAILAGLGLGLLVAFVRERLSDPIRSPDDVIEKLKLPLLGTTPHVAGAVTDQLGHSRSALSEAYHSVRSSLEFASASGVPKSILVTSSRAGEGKSTTAVAIAADFARRGRKVLLVDADLRLPTLHKTLAADNEFGFVHVLTGHRTVAQTAKTYDSGVAVLTSGPIPPNPTELLAPENIQTFIDAVQNEFDLVVFDGPPVMGLADSPQISRAAEATVLVIEATRARRNHVKTAVRRLQAANANLIGVVFTKFSAKSAGYSDDYGYYYYYGSAGVPKPLKG